MNNINLKFLVYIASLTVIVLSLNYNHVSATSLIRDTEIESSIQSYITPVLQEAHLDPSSVEVYIINDNALNAFVAGGQKIFLNSGFGGP